MIQQIWMFASTMILNMLHPRSIFLVSERANWVIYEISKSLFHSLKIKGYNVQLSYHLRGIRNSVIHVMSFPALFSRGQIQTIHPSNKLVLTLYHIVKNDERIAKLMAIIDRVSYIHVTNTLTRDQLLAVGVSEEKLVLIPESINLQLFGATSEARKKEIRNELGIPIDAVVIGSFQKDGQGWGAGMEPKLEKGPDYLCDILEQLKETLGDRLFVLLTGPARGYVRARLENAGIPYVHHILDDLTEIPKYYQALDWYVISSRVEGGPKAVLESMACGVPLISSCVGMAADLIQNEKNGFLVDVGDTKTPVQIITRYVDDVDIRHQIASNALKIAAVHEETTVHNTIIASIYAPLTKVLWN